MTTLKILDYPHPLLKFKARTLKKVDTSIKNILGEMIELMHIEKGNGLAAPQVGFPLRVIVLTYSKQDFAFINPVVTPIRKAKTETRDEGCLSMMGLFVPVDRFKRIRFTAWTPNGDDVDEILDADLARIIQHEVDHLDGRLITDRVSQFVAPQVKQTIKQFKEDANKQFNPHLGSNNIDHTLLNDLLETYC